VPALQSTAAMATFCLHRKISLVNKYHQPKLLLLIKPSMRSVLPEIVTATFVCLATSHAQSFIYSTSQSLFVTPYANISGYSSLRSFISLNTTLSGQVDIDPLSGLVSVSGTLNALFGTVSPQVSLNSQVTFHPNPFPTPGGFSTTNTTGVVLQTSLGNFPVSQVFSVSGVTPIYVAPNN
jgi:hypothetical protein